MFWVLCFRFWVGRYRPYFCRKTFVVNDSRVNDSLVLPSAPRPKVQGEPPVGGLGCGTAASGVPGFRNVKDRRSALPAAGRVILRFGGGYLQSCWIFFETQLDSF